MLKNKNKLNLNFKILHNLILVFGLIMFSVISQGCGTDVNNSDEIDILGNDDKNPGDDDNGNLKFYSPTPTEYQLAQIQRGGPEIQLPEDKTIEKIRVCIDSLELNYKIRGVKEIPVNKFFDITAGGSPEHRIPYNLIPGDKLNGIKLNLKRRCDSEKNPNTVRSAYHLVVNNEGNLKEFNLGDDISIRFNGDEQVPETGDPVIKLSFGMIAVKLIQQMSSLTPSLIREISTSEMGFFEMSIKSEVNVDSFTKLTPTAEQMDPLLLSGKAIDALDLCIGSITYVDENNENFAFEYAKKYRIYANGSAETPLAFPRVLNKNIVKIKINVKGNCSGNSDNPLRSMGLYVINDESQQWIPIETDLSLEFDGEHFFSDEEKAIKLSLGEIAIQIITQINSLNTETLTTLLQSYKGDFTVIDP